MKLINIAFVYFIHNPIYITMENILNPLFLGLIILIIAGMWQVFIKAGRKGWESIIPIYNLFIIQKIIKKPWWWLLLMFIPYIGVIWTIWSTNLLVKRFGKNKGYTVGLILFPFIYWPILGFGKAEFTETAKPEIDEKIIEVESQEVSS